ncbi:MAG: ChaB family protein [Candidatus Andersenbacteria bacterium]|nr:ChaB family protein [Candidatus Andersenbacteria bacterium]MBI3250631.1 ChaB family protein [Candidatus Andersenbacteria bacterium]
MPYSTRTQLPQSVRSHLPPYAQEIYKEAFNSARRQYGQESRAHKVAWAAVKKKYAKGSDRDWHRK